MLTSLRHPLQAKPLLGTLRRRDLVAADTYELEFDLGDHTVDFAAGQYCRVEVTELSYPDDKDSRKFSIVNAPRDNRRLVIATRTGPSGYKRTLCGLCPGQQVRIKKVKGKLVLGGDDGSPRVFIAGGIGITPFISMLRDLDDGGRLRRVALLYVNRTPADAAYLAELDRMSRRHPGFALVTAMTRDPDWPGETEHVSQDLLTRLTRDRFGLEPTVPEYYVVGTPVMADSTVSTLTAADVSPNHIHQEDFTGYEPH